MGVWVCFFYGGFGVGLRALGFGAERGWLGGRRGGGGGAV